MRQRLGAFSLVELSIVLVILGLLVGGVLSGKSLIRASQLRAVMNQQQSFRAATLTFKEKYFYLPGDLPNATQFWGTAADCGIAATDKTTCNGDGNGLIANSEDGRYWQHLSNAGLIPGQYCGLASDIMPVFCSPNPKTPYGKIGTGSWRVRDYATKASPAGFGGFYGNYGNSLIYPSDQSSSTAARRGFDPQESKNIDIKMDDGMAPTGKVVAHSATGGGFLHLCTTVNSTDSLDVKSATLTADYLVSSTAIECALIWRQQF